MRPSIPEKTHIKPNTFTKVCDRIRLAATLICVAALAAFPSQASEGIEREVSPPTLVEAQRARSTEWHFYKTVTLDHLVGFEPEKIALSKYGGRLDRREQATGFFHTQRLEDRWVIVDPEGYHFWAMGVNIVTPQLNHKERAMGFEEKFGTEEGWARQTRKQLVEDYHFNSLGNWSDEGQAP